MESYRTANFYDKNENIENNVDNSFRKINTNINPTPTPKLSFDFKCFKEKEKENENEKNESGFSFKSELLSRRTYEFLKDKDECLGEINLDDVLPGD